MFSDLPKGKRHAAGERHTLRKLASQAKADPDALTVTLFRDADGAPRGWFIGPLTVSDGRASLSYLPRSNATNAAVAVVRAIAAAKAAGCPLCLIDPDDLWDKVWRD